MVEAARPWRRALVWLAVLGPFFFLSYGFANWMAGQQTGLPSIVFDWEMHIPFVPWTIVPYWSIDVFYVVSFFICAHRAELDAHGRRLLTAQLIAVACFLLWPLRFSFERPDSDGIFGWLFAVLLGFDKPFNQAPSLHIVLLIVLWVRFAAHLHGLWRWCLHVWFALIGVSVLTTFQHHFVDIPTGVAVGWLCVWLWPQEGPSPLARWSRPRDPLRWKLALAYTAGAALCTVLAVVIGGWAWWALWPALSLLLVAVAYAGPGVAVLAKRNDGRLSMAARWLLAPYLLAAWLNSRWWTRRAPAPVPVDDGVWLGRMPLHNREQRWHGLVDVCAELSSHGRFAQYRSIPMLDLAAPEPAALRRAANAISELHAQGPVLVCCALGYSRSAAALATWLCLSGRATSPDAAVALLAERCPHIVLRQRHRDAIGQACRPGDAPAALPLATS